VTLLSIQMANLDQLIEQMRNNPKNIRYVDLLRICKQYFGEPRQTSGSHTVFKTPWQGDPRINLQMTMERLNLIRLGK